jgi:hypothetical protein
VNWEVFLEGVRGVDLDCGDGTGLLVLSEASSRSVSCKFFRCPLGGSGAGRRLGSVLDFAVLGL